MSSASAVRFELVNYFLWGAKRVKQKTRLTVILVVVYVLGQMSTSNRMFGLILLPQPRTPRITVQRARVMNARIDLPRPRPSFEYVHESTNGQATPNRLLRIVSVASADAVWTVDTSTRYIRLAVSL